MSSFKILTAFFKNNFIDPHLRIRTENLQECGLYFRTVVSNVSKKIVLKLKSPPASSLLSCQEQSWWVLFPLSQALLTMHEMSLWAPWAHCALPQLYNHWQHWTSTADMGFDSDLWKHIGATHVMVTLLVQNPNYRSREALTCSHCMAVVGRDLWVHAFQAQLQQGHPQQAAQGHAQLTALYLQEGDSTASQWWASELSVHPLAGWDRSFVLLLQYVHAPSAHKAPL